MSFKTEVVVLVVVVKVHGPNMSPGPLGPVLTAKCNRGLPVEDPHAFSEFLKAFDYDAFPYVGGAAPRTEVRLGRGTPYGRDIS
jgi:hypothetical protein